MAPSKRALQRAEEAIQATIAQADRCVSLEDADGVRARRDLLSVLEAADVHLAKRIASITPKRDGSMKFSQAQAITYRTQVGLVIERVKFQLEPVATEAGQAAIDKSLRAGAHVMAKLEEEFKGLSVSPALLAGMQQSQVARGTRASLVTRVATSLDRYGLEMGSQFSRILQVGLVSGMSNEEMVAQLIGHGGPRGRVSLKAKEVAPGVVQRIKEGDIPEGLFVRHKYWAERIVRTEVAYAHSSARLEQLYVMRNDGLEVQKKIVAHFDNRTAADSVAVHGQIRQLAENFMDGAGRLYLHPPGRPNDRETLIPWFDDWKETPSTEPPTPEQIERVEQIEKADPIAPPPTTVEELQRVKAVSEEAAALEVAKAAETAAAERVLQLERERIASVQALALKLEEEKKAAMEAAERRKTEALSFRISKTFKGPGARAKTKDGGAHEGALDIIHLAATKPEAFARLYAYKVGTQLPVDTFTKGAPKSHKVLEMLTQDVIGQYGDLNYLALEEFKRSDKFAPFLSRLERAGDARSRQLLASLVHSEAPLFMKPTQVALPWKTSQEIAKKSPALAVAQIRQKYGISIIGEKYRAKYGHELAERMGRVDMRTEEALDLTIDAALERARKLPDRLGTYTFLQDLKDQRTKIMSLRQLGSNPTLRQVIGATMSYDSEVRGHAALLGHVHQLDKADPAKFIKMENSQKDSIDRVKRRANPSAGDQRTFALLRRAREGAEHLAALTQKGLEPGHYINYDPKGRASCSTVQVNMTEHTSVETVCHEFGHAMEFKNQALGEAGTAFLQARAKGLALDKLKKLVPGSGYEDDEVAYVGSGFKNPYTGREYYPHTGGHIRAGKQQSNEVMAMGITHLYSGEVHKLQAIDPDHLVFTLAQLRGK